LFADADRNRAVLNIGGIANVTMLGKGGAPVVGFDTGPGNTLLDAWIRHQRGRAFDEAGAWAAEGAVTEALLGSMLDDPYFAEAPPKSTGFEYFNEAWLSALLAADMKPADVQATLAELTAVSIAGAIRRYANDTGEVLICGGGVHNRELLRRLGEHLGPVALASTADAGLDPDRVEACAFAWLAMRTMNGEPGNAPGVTGASRETVLGAIHSSR